MKLRSFALALLAGLALAPPAPGFTPTLVAQDDQCDGYSGSLWITGTWAGYTCESADDFEIPASQFGWQVVEVHAPGKLLGILNAVDVVFYRADGDSPGEPVCARRDLHDYVLSNGGLTIELVDPCELPLVADADTRYWLSVQARVGTPTDWSAWSWSERTVLEHSPAVWRNPSNGIGTGCVDWSVRTACQEGNSPDQCFALLGFPALFSSGFETGDTSRWSFAVE